MTSLAALTDDEVLEQVRVEGLALGLSHDAIDGMLEKRTPRQALGRLRRQRRARQTKFEREDHRRWLTEQATERAEVHAKESALNEKRRAAARSKLRLSKRVDDLLNRALVATEQTRGTAFEGKTTGSREDTGGIPVSHGPTLREEVGELLLAAIERCEEDVDRAVQHLPPIEREARNAQIVATTGPAFLVALRWSCSESHVRKLRAENALNPGTGYPKKPERKAA